MFPVPFTGFDTTLETMATPPIGNNGFIVRSRAFHPTEFPRFHSRQRITIYSMTEQSALFAERAAAMIIVEICEEMNSKTNGAIDTQVRVVHSASTLFFSRAIMRSTRTNGSLKKGETR